MADSARRAGAAAAAAGLETVPYGSAEWWALALAQPTLRARFDTRRWIDPTDPDGCWPWLGSLSSTGHGSWRVATMADGRGTAPAHLVAYQLARGPIPAPRHGEPVPAVSHRCDEHYCTAPHHLVLGTQASNHAEYYARQQRAVFLDTRGPRGRALAVRDAVTAAITRGATPDQIRAAMAEARALGEPATLF